MKSSPTDTPPKPEDPVVMLQLRKQLETQLRHILSSPHLPPELVSGLRDALLDGARPQAAKPSNQPS